MPITAYQHSLSSPGYMPDMAHGSTPPQVWTDGANVRFENGAPTTARGMSSAYTVTTSVIHALNAYNSTATFWALATPTALYTTDGATLTDITRVSASTTVILYTANATKNWTSAAFGTYLLFNNSVDVPQSWYIGPGAVVPAEDLANWPTGWTARAIGTYQDHIVAMGINISGSEYPSLVAWSDNSPYDAVTLPAWVPATTNKAGDTNLSDTPGRCVDGLALGGSFIIYKEDSVWAMTKVGGSTVMAFRKMFEGVGLLTRRCVQEFNGQHFFVSRGDVYVTDGVALRSIAAGRIREKMFGSMSASNFERTFTAIDRSRREIWVCYPTTGDYPTEALVWSYESDTWHTPRAMPATAHMAFGVSNFSSGLVTFDGGVGTTFAADTDIFASEINSTELKLLACVPDLPNLYLANDGTTIPTSSSTGVALTHSLTRKLLPFVNQDITGQPALWSPAMKTIRRVWLDATGTGVVSVYLGVHPNESTPAVWYGPFNVNLEQQLSVWTLLRGRFFSIKFESDSSAGSWSMTGYRIEWSPSGGF